MDQTDRLDASLSDEGRYRLLIDAITDYAIYMLDADGVVTSWNPGAQRFKGYTASEIVGQHFSRFYTEEDRAAGVPKRALNTAAAEGRFEQEGWRVRKDGRRMWAHVVIDPVRNSNGEVIAYAKITRDLTERKQAQEALEEAREALFQSQKMDAIGQLTGGVAHDFNNLLMAVIGSLELVSKRLPDDPKIKGLVDNAMQAAHRGAALTRRMLAFARRQELKSEAVEVPQLVRGMSELLERSLGPTIRIDLRFPDALPRVLTDANQLEMALLNLAVNARDAMPDGGAITISAYDQEIADPPEGLAPGRFVCLSVTDTGEGMDEVTLNRAMEPFYTTKGVGKGTGLGLSMVHGLAAQSGGRMDLRSQLGIGTTVSLWLPVSSDHAPAAVLERPGNAPAVQMGSRRVLVVDDDPLVLMNTAAMLEDLGHAVFQAPSGSEALRILDATPDLDIVISDQVMPEMTGVELARLLKVKRPELPLVLATGFAELPDTDVPLVRLAKPFLQKELASALDQALAPGP